MTGGTSCTVFTAQWVFPMSSPPIAEGAVVVDGAHIAFVGRAADLPATFVSDPCVALGQAVIMPGLVNVHTHLELTAMRGFLEGLPFNAWLKTLTHARRDCFDHDSLVDSSCAGIEEGLRNGITTYADTTESGAPLAAMRTMGVRGIGYLEVFGPDPQQCASAIADLVARADASRAHDTPLVRTGLSPHAPYTVSDSLYSAVANVAAKGQWPVAVHIAESDAELALVTRGEGAFADSLRARGIAVSPRARSPIALLEQTGLLACRPLLIHAIGVDAADIDLIAEHRASVAHCPISNLKLGHAVAPFTAMRDARIPIGLGTDSMASNDRMDLLGEARQCALLASWQQRVPDALSAAETLYHATLGGATALGLDAEIGSLDVGKQADLAAFRLDDVDTQPVHDPAVTLVHVLAGRAVADVVLVAGETRVRHGRIVGIDPARHARMVELGHRLQKWRLGISAP